jgi:hypothetical protein
MMWITSERSFEKFRHWQMPHCEMSWKLKAQRPAPAHARSTVFELDRAMLEIWSESPF